jgi:hypothetical protein
MIDREFAERYRATWDKAFKRGSSMPEELDREHMLLTKERKRALIQDLSFELGETPVHLLAAQSRVALEAATFTDGVQAAIVWLENRAKENR